MSREEHKSTESLQWHFLSHTPLQLPFRDFFRKLQGLSVLSGFFCHQSNCFSEPTQISIHSILWHWISLFSCAVRDNENVFFTLTTYYFHIYHKKQHTAVPIHHQHAAPDSYRPPLCSPLSCFKKFRVLCFILIKSFAQWSDCTG